MSRSMLLWNDVTWSAEQHFHARGRIGADSDDLTVPEHTVVDAGLRLEQLFLETEAFHANSGDDVGHTVKQHLHAAEEFGANSEPC